MFEYIKGHIVELTPASVVMENQGIAYFINISVNTFSQLTGAKSAQLFLHQVVREDAHLLFGFAQKHEREVFRALISVSGVGANTGRMMLSSLTSAEIQSAIANGSVDTLKGVKGIGIKTAQRIIIELKDKLVKGVESEQIILSQDNTLKEEALSALVMLGFAKNSVVKVLDKILSKEADHSVESLIKRALKSL